MDRNKDRICRLCTHEVGEKDAIYLFSTDRVERGVPDRMATVLELPLEEDDGLSSYVCQICNARFNHLLRQLEVHRLNAKKSLDRLAKKAGIHIEILDDPIQGSPAVEDAKNTTKDPLVQAADMTSMDLGSLLSDLVAAKQRMREKAPPTEKKIVTEDIKDLMNLLSGIRREDVFVFGMFLGIPEPRLRDLELNYSDNLQRLLAEVITAWINTCPEAATWANLVEALTEVGRRKTAQQVAEKRGIVLPGVFDDGQLWKALKALIPTQEGGSDLMTLLDETEQLRKDVKSKDALLLANENQLQEVNEQKEQFEKQYNDTLQQLEEQKQLLDEQKTKAEKVLKEKEAELRKMRADRASKEEIESMEIEIMRLRKKVQQHQAQEKELVAKIVDLQQKLETHDLSKLEWISKNLEKQLEGIRPEFETERSHMMSNIYKMLKYIKIPEEIMGEEHDESPEADVVAVEDNKETNEEEEEREEEEEEEEEEEKEVNELAEHGEDPEVNEEQLQETTPEPEHTDLESLLSSLKSPTEEISAVTMFEDKPFVREDHSLAMGLFEGVPPFLLSQILGLTMEQWQAIEAADRRDEEKQRSSVLHEWGKNSKDTANWSVLVEALIELGRRGKAQTAWIEKGIPLPELMDDGPVWFSIKETLLSGTEEAKQLLAEVDELRLEVKSRDEVVCVKETLLDQASSESELIKANLKRAKHSLAKDMSQCKALEMQIGLLSSQVDETQSPNQNEHANVCDPELRDLRRQHRKQMDVIQNHWKEQEDRKAEYEMHTARLEPQLQELHAMKGEFAAVRDILVAKMEEMYNLYTGRQKHVPKVVPARPPPPQPPAPVVVPPSPSTPGGYQASKQLLPTSDPVLPTEYTIMDLFHPSNTFSLLPAIDIVRRPLAVSGNLFTGLSIKGRGSLAQECIFVSEIAAPFVVTLMLPNRGRLMVDDRRMVTIKNTPYQPGDPSFEFIIRPYEDKRVTFESRKFAKCFLSVNQSATVSVQELPPSSSEIQFVVRVQRFNGPYTTKILGPFGRPSLVNQLKDRSVVQLYSKATGVYLGLRVNGSLVGMTNPDNNATYLVYYDRGLGRVSLQSYTHSLHKIKMRFNGILTCQGAENLDNDFYLKENPDSTVVFESVPYTGRFINIKKDKVTIANFSIYVLVFAKGQGKTTTVTKYPLN